MPKSHFSSTDIGHTLQKKFLQTQKLSRFKGNQNFILFAKIEFSQMVLFCMGCVVVIREIVLSLNDHGDNNDHVGDGEDNQIDDDDGGDNEHNEYDDNKHCQRHYGPRR